MDCPACGTPSMTFTVPQGLRAHAPAGSVAAICPTCLTLGAFDGDAPAPADVDFDDIIEGFPEGETGAAMAVAVGLLVDSLALNRDAIKALFDRVSDDGADPWLVLERLAVAGSVQPEADLSRIRNQLEQLWG